MAGKKQFRDYRKWEAFGEMIHNFINSGGRIERNLEAWELLDAPAFWTDTKEYTEEEFAQELSKSDLKFYLLSHFHFTIGDKFKDEDVEWYLCFSESGDIILRSQTGEYFVKKTCNPKCLRDVVKEFVDSGGFLLLNTVRFKWREQDTGYLSNINSNDCNVPAREEIHNVDEIMGVIKNRHKPQNNFYEFLKKRNENDNWRDALVYNIVSDDDGNYKFEEAGYKEDWNPKYNQMYSSFEKYWDDK